MSDALLDELRAEKKVKASLTRPKTKLGHDEQYFELASIANPARRFTLYTRQSSTDPDVFSAGLLVHLSDGETLVLCRYNGPYHSHKNKIEGNKVPATYHRHVTYARYIALNRPDGFAEAQQGYSNLSTAILKLVQDCCIQGMPSPPLPTPPPTPDPQQSLLS